MAAVGYGSFDGWEAWQIDDGRFLTELRQELLDRAAAEEPDPAGLTEPTEQKHASLSPAERHTRLKEAREKATAGDPLALSVQELLEWWGRATGRGIVNEQIEADLANHSLVTSPEFDKVPLTTRVSLVRATEGDAGNAPVEGAVGPSAPTVTASASTPDEEEARETGLTVGTLPSPSAAWSASHRRLPSRRSSH